jgi:hypothetical protein
LGGALVVASLGLACSTFSAHAASDLCSQLEAQLASSGGSAHVSKYDDAIAQQRQQLLLARDRTAEAGCGFSMVGAGIRYCAKLNARIESMERNLDKLQRQRAKSSTKGAVRADRQLLALLDANGCRAGNEIDNSDLIEEIFDPPSKDIGNREPDDLLPAPDAAPAGSVTTDLEINAGKHSPADTAAAAPVPSPSIVTPDVAAPPKAVAPKPQVAGEDAVPHQPDPNRKVRVVGPTFLPTPEAAKDQPVQDPIQAR